MHKKIILSFSLLAFAASAFGQTYTYIKKEDNPKNAKNLNISLTTGLNFGLLDMPVNLQGNFSFSRFSFEGLYGRGLSTYLKSEGDVAAGFKPATVFEASGAIYFLDKVKSTSYNYVLSSSTYGNTTTTKFLPIPVFKRVQYGVRGGIARFRMSDKMGSKDSGYVAGQDYRSLATSSTFFGLNFRKVRNLKVGVEGYKRTKSVKQVRDFYVDVFLSPGTTIIYSGNRNFVGKGEDIRNFGFRIGWNWRSNRVFGGNFKLEFGLLPGYIIPRSDLYTLMTYGICISNRIGKKGDDIYKPTQK